MLVAAHALQIVVLIATPLWLARWLCRRWKLPVGIVGVGLLTFIAGQVAQMALERVTRFGFEEGFLPAPAAENAILVGALLAGVAAAICDEPLRWVAFERYLPEHQSARGGLLHGLGHGGGQAMLTGALVLLMATLAIVFQGQTFEEMQQAGFEGRSAVRMGMKVFAWWESEPSHALLATARALLVLLMHVGLSASVARGLRSGRRWLWLAMGVHAISAGAIVWVVQTDADLGPTLGVYAAVGAMGAVLAIWSGRSES